MKIGISEAFRRYGAVLKNVNWSVSSWAAENILVVSLWDHHATRPGSGVLAFEDRFDRWSGPGNREFRANVTRAYDTDAAVHLILARALQPERIQHGEDGSKVPKTFAVRDDLIGRVANIDGENYVIEFRQVIA
ncbi:MULTISPECIES: hypothetical protein [Xanthomonas]|uniref:Uncharacterized protein n=1 Tax=Xanthomonas cucurbitae TaxID=56453 RepID=A0ABY7YAK9_9XANT|nr:hypothetical protein [Xanthomonas cucurbitae]WDM67031.1 hypothetical protein K6981_16255 [Xanthomonas cucurbitae]WDM70909.1 hypothetical protein K6978_16225 [Xanthomonas cucurbitae]WDM74732.1 hypothetical protein K6982_15300 [Xanthomonas cucurbitae]